VSEIRDASFFILNCNTVNVEGELKSGTPLNAGNIMKLMVDVITPGVYTIMGRAEPQNGYYFYTSGEFKTTGVFEVVATGAGTPIRPRESPAYETIVVELNGVKSDDCVKQVEVKNTVAAPKYSLACQWMKVNGIYKVGKDLDQSNTINVTINVEEGTQGAPYHIYTNEVGGIKFEGSGVLSGAGTYVVTLSGSGKPDNSTAKTLTVTTNSQSSAVTCQIKVQPVMPQKNIVAIGAIKYGLTSKDDYGCDKMISDKLNYGTDINSIVKYEGFTNVTVETDISDDIIGKYTGENRIDRPYDVILITYNLRPKTQNQRQWLTNYVNKGGVLIYLDQGRNSENVEMIASIFGTSAPGYALVGNNCNHVIKLNNVNDEILNGPFGDIRGGQWGEDFDNTCGLTNIPNGAIIYSGAINAYTGQQGGGRAADVKVTMMRHPTKNFFWCGDSGLIHADVGSDTKGPFSIGEKIINGIRYPNYPLNKLNYGNGGANMPVCNSTLFANVMAWALKKTEENGINKGK